MADAATCTIPNQTTPQGDYNLECMVKAVIHKGVQVKARDTCLDAHGLKALPLIEGVEASNMLQLAQWTLAANKVLTF